MNRKTIPMFFVLLLASCSAFETKSPTPNTVLGTPPATATPERVDIGDGGLLSGLPCASPCVFGIRIDETRLDEIIPLLEKNNISPCQREVSVSWIAVSCGYSVSAQVDTQTNNVNAIWFVPSTSITLGDIIKKYGDPNFVAVRGEGPAEAPTIRTILNWDSIRMSIETPQIDGKSYDLKKTTGVEGVSFSNEELYSDSSEIQFGEFYQPWKGYGVYQP